MPLPCEDDQARATGTTSADGRRWFFVALLAAITPVVVAAVRNGLSGWTPTYDTALTIVRVRDVFSAHPPLVGMWSAGTAWAGHEIYFPGPLQLYLLAIPVQILGYRWGTLLGMAALNIGWILVAAWLVQRRVGARQATIGCAFMALLGWSLGSELLVAAEPIHMILYPTMAFLIAVWSVADGDVVAIPVLVAIANFLVLDHLALTLFVPFVGLCAPIGLVLALRRAKHTAPDAWPALRKRVGRMLGLSAVVTVVMWLPSLLQELTNDPGNLTNLARSASADSPYQATYSTAVNSVTSLLSRPPFWFRNSFENPPFQNTLQTPQLVLGLGIVVAVSGLGVLAYRRGDRTVVTLLAVFGVAIAGAIQNFVTAPGTAFGVRPIYHRALWPVAMMGWMAITIALWQSLPRTRQRRFLDPGPVFAAVAILAAVAALPAANQGAITTEASVRVADTMIREVVPQLPDHGTIRIKSTYSVQASYLAPALALALDARGIDYCIADVSARQYGAVHRCGPEAPDDVTIGIYASTDDLPADAQVIADIDTTLAAHRREQDRLEARLTDWLATTPTLEVTPEVRALMVRGNDDDTTQEMLAVLSDTPPNERASLVDDRAFTSLVHYARFVIEHRDALGETGPIDDDRCVFVGCSLGYKSLFRWYELTRAAVNEQIVVTMS